LSTHLEIHPKSSITKTMIQKKYVLYALFGLVVVFSSCISKTYDKPVVLETSPSGAQIYYSGDGKTFKSFKQITPYSTVEALPRKCKYLQFRMEGYVPSDIIEFPGFLRTSDTCYKVIYKLESIGSVPPDINIPADTTQVASDTAFLIAAHKNIRSGGFPATFRKAKVFAIVLTVFLAIILVFSLIILFAGLDDDEKSMIWTGLVVSTIIIIIWVLTLLPNLKNAKLIVSSTPEDSYVYVGANPDDLKIYGEVVQGSSYFVKTPCKIKLKKIRNSNYIQIRKWGYQESDVMPFPVNKDKKGNYMLAVSLKKINGYNKEIHTDSKLSVFGYTIITLAGLTCLILFIVFMVRLFRFIQERLQDYFSEYNRERRYESRVTRLISKYKTKKKLRKIYPYLKNKNYAVICEASKALGEIRDTRSEPYLTKALEEHSMDCIARALAELIEKYKEEKNLEKIHAYLLIKSNIIVTAACKAIGEIQDTRSEPYLLKALESEPRECVAQALAKLIDKYKTNKNLEKLQSFLYSKNSVIVCAACKALGEIWDIRSEAYLITALEKEPHECIARTLVEIMGNKSVPYLINALEKKPSTFIVEALGKTADTSILEPMAGVLKNNADIKLKDAIIRSFANFNIRDVLKIITTMLQDENPALRATSAEVLGTYNSSSAIHPLLGALKDGDGTVRRVAAIALRSIMDKDKNARMLISKNSQAEINRITYSEYAVYSESHSDSSWTCRD